MRPHKRQQNKSWKTRRGAGSPLLRLFGRILFAGVLAAAAIFALTIFFRVKTISVEGATRYSAEEIVAGMDIQKGDNLFLWNKIRVSDALLERFPYLETVQIRRTPPDILTVTVTEGDAALAVPLDGGYFLISRQGKVLEQAASSGGLPIAAGVSLMGLQPGKMIARGEDAYADALLAALQALDATDMLAETRYISLQSLTDVRIGYCERFEIRPGTVDQIAYRLQFARMVIADRLSPSDTGSLYWDARDRLHFVPDTDGSLSQQMAAMGSGGAAKPEDGTGTGDNAPPEEGAPEDDIQPEEGG